MLMRSEHSSAMTMRKTDSSSRSISRSTCKHEILAEYALDIFRVIESAQESFECLNINGACPFLILLLQRDELAFKVKTAREHE